LVLNEHWIYAVHFLDSYFFKRANPMNIYFACSITGGRQDEATYAALVTALLVDGHTVPTASLARPEVMEQEGRLSPEEVYGRDVAWIEACDALIAEVSTPSHGVGYEIGYALSKGKPVLCCYRQGRRVSKMISGNLDPNLKTQEYTSEVELAQLARAFLHNLAPGG
jgi:2'-deoxynucleoside 5'-phosphate N-hydrolase